MRQTQENKHNNYVLLGIQSACIFLTPNVFNSKMFKIGWSRYPNFLKETQRTEFLSRQTSGFFSRSSYNKLPLRPEPSDLFERHV